MQRELSDHNVSLTFSASPTGSSGAEDQFEESHTGWKWLGSLHCWLGATPRMWANSWRLLGSHAPHRWTASSFEKRAVWYTSMSTCDGQL